MDVPGHGDVAQLETTRTSAQGLACRSVLRAQGEDGRADTAGVQPLELFGGKNAFTVWQSWFAKLWSLVLAVAILIVILFAALNGLLSWETNF